MISISLCMIVKNEEKVLARCLESVVGVVDEIIIVDTGSTDGTKEIARKFTDLVYEFEWVDDFSAARNFSFSKARKDYQMWLDADDILTEEDREKLIMLKSQLDNHVDIVTMKYNTHFDEDNNPILTFARERLFKRSKGYKWNDPIHEYIEMNGVVYHAKNIFVTHLKEAEYSDRNLKIYEKQVEAGKELSPRSIYYFARELRDHGRNAEAAKYFNIFLDQGLGWVEDNISACFSLIQCYKVSGEHEKIWESAIRTFKYGPPRAEICCELGYYFKRIRNFNNASFWFSLAASLEQPQTDGFVLNDYWNYIPLIELAVCHYELNDLEKAEIYNEQAKQFKPNSKSVKSNEEFFKKIRSK